MKIAVFASGKGTNFEAIVRGVQTNQIPGTIALLFCDQPNAKVIERGNAHNIPTIVIEKKPREGKKEYEARIVAELRERGVELIVLAGYMKILGDTLLSAFPKKILNIHPSLLPLFPGKQGIVDAYNAGVEETGITIHVVDRGIDTGPIIFQQSIPCNKGISLAELEHQIHALEHQHYPKIIGDYITKECRIDGEE